MTFRVQIVIISSKLTSFHIIVVHGCCCCCSATLLLTGPPPRLIVITRRSYHLEIKAYITLLQKCWNFIEVPPIQVDGAEAYIKSLFTLWTKHHNSIRYTTNNILECVANVVMNEDKGGSSSSLAEEKSTTDDIRTVEWTFEEKQRFVKGKIWY